MAREFPCETISKSVPTMSVDRKYFNVAGKNIYNTELVYARAMALQSSVRSFNTNDLMAHKLSAEPASMLMSTSTTKATLKNKLKVEISARHVAVDVTFLD